MSSTTRVPDRVLHLDQISEVTALPVSTLRYLRLHGRGPRMFRLGRRVVALESDVLAWIEQQREAG